MTQQREKFFIVDTNIYLSDARDAVYSFRPDEAGKKNTIIIPYVVQEEIDKFKGERSSRGTQAREFGKVLSEILQKEENEDSYLSAGIEVVSGLKIQSDFNNYGELEKKLRDQYTKKNDNIILSAAYSYMNKYELEGKDVELITNDTNLLLKASALGIPASPWEAGMAANTYDNLYRGWRDITVDEAVIDYLIPDYNNVFPADQLDLEEEPVPNEYFILKEEGADPIPQFSEDPRRLNDRSFILARYAAEEEGLKRVKYRSRKSDRVLGVNAKNVFQSFALDALLNPRIKFVSMYGVAGTGKTFLALASGLAQQKSGSNDKITKSYDVVRIARPPVIMGEDMGFLPGSLEEKMNPFLQPIYDNLKILRKGLSDKYGGKPGESVEYIEDVGYLDIVSLGHIRGRTLPNSYFIIDEAQNTDISESKTIVTRAGEGTKMVFTGDPESVQMDREGNTSLSNGLCYTSERMKESDITATIYLPEESVVRSELAQLAARSL